MRAAVIIPTFSVCTVSLGALTDIAQRSVGQIPADFEPSGICWHSGDSRLVVVGDGGDIAVMDTAGNNQNVFDPGFKAGVTFGNTYGFDDIEAVCMGPDLSQNALVFVGVERDFVDGNDQTGPRQIRALDLVNEEYVAEWEISQIGDEDNRGIEGMTFVPNRHIKDAGFASAYEKGTSKYQTGDFTGGLFFVAKEKLAPRIYVIDIDLDTSGTYTDTTILLNPGFSRISGLDYNRDTRILYVLNGSANSSKGQVKLFSLGSGGTITEVGTPTNLPSDHNHTATREGIAYSSTCNVQDGDDTFYAWDSGFVEKDDNGYYAFISNCRGNSVYCECILDVDGNGVINPVDAGLIQAHYGSTDPLDLAIYDVDCDGQFNPVDAGFVQTAFGNSCPCGASSCS